MLHTIAQLYIATVLFALPCYVMSILSRHHIKLWRHLHLITGAAAYIMVYFRSPPPLPVYVFVAGSATAAFLITTYWMIHDWRLNRRRGAVAK